MVCCNLAAVGRDQLAIFRITSMVLPRIWRKGVKTEDKLNFESQKSVTQFMKIFISTKFASSHQLMFLLPCMGETCEMFPWTPQIQKINLPTYTWESFMAG